MVAIRLSRRRAAALAGGYAAAIVALTALLFAAEARTAQLVGLHRAVYPEVGFAGTPLVDDVSPGIDLDFLAGDPRLPRRFFSVRWQGFWYVPEAGEVELHGAGDDRLDVWLDGELLIRRRPPADMHTETRVLTLDAGVHDLRVEYEQHGGAYAARLLWAPREGRPRPLPLHAIFHSRPGSDDLRLVRRTAWLRVVVALGWGAPVVSAIVFLVRRATARRARKAPAGGHRPANTGRPGGWIPGRRLAPAAPPPQPGPAPLPRSRRLGMHGAFLALSALFCSNVFLLTDLDSHAILGGDPALMNWQLQWVSRALFTDPANLFHGNVFHPHPNVVALTDHMLALAVVNAPLSLLSESPWFGYNVLIFLAYYLSCAGGYWFVREMTGSHHAGAWAGVFWAFLFFRIHHMGHLQVLSYQGMPFVAAVLIRFLRSPSPARTAALTVAFLWQALVSWYLAAIAAVLAGVLALLHAGAQRLTLRHAAGAAAGVAVCAALLVPAALPYRTSLASTDLGARAAEALVPGDRVSLTDYLEPPRATLIGQLRQAGPSIWGERTLYVGYTALALALAGLFLRRGRAPAGAGDERAGASAVNGRWIATGVCLIVVGFVLARGFISSQQTPLPLYYLSELPGLDFLKGLRATPRFSLLLYFGVMILSAAGVAALAARCRSARTARVVVILLCAAFLVEVYPFRLPVEPRPYEVSRLDRAIPRIWQDEQRAPVVLHLPIHYFLRDYATPEAVYMLDSTHHWARVVNGFSGAEPRGFRATMAALHALPDERGVTALAELEVDLVAIHRTAPGEMRRALAAFFEAAPWAAVLRLGDESLVQIDRASIPHLPEGGRGGVDTQQ